MTFTEFIRSLSAATPTAWGAMLTVAGLITVFIIGALVIELSEKREAKRLERVTNHIERGGRIGQR